MPFEVPNSWEWVTLGDISNYGQTKHTDVLKIPEEDWVLELEDVEKDSGRLIQTLSRKDRKISGVRCEIECGQILYSKLRTYLNKVLIAPKKGFCTTEIIPFYCFGKISHYYITSVLRSQYFIDYTTLCCYGCKMPRLSTDDARKGMIPLPPIAEQKRIVLTIKHLFLLIDSIDASKNDLQEAVDRCKTKVLDLAIHGKLVSQDPNDEPAVELLKRINPNVPICDTSHYPNLPESWCIVKLGDIYNHTTGKALKKSNTDGVLRKYITTSNLYWNSFDLKEVRSMYFTKEELEKCTVHKGDLLLCNGGDVGRAAIWNYDEDICIQNHISRLRPKYENIAENLFYYYVLMYLKQNGLLNGKGVAITSLSAADLLSIQVPMPPKKEQVRIVQKIQEIEKRIQEICEEL